MTDFKTGDPDDPNPTTRYATPVDPGPVDPAPVDPAPVDATQGPPEPASPLSEPPPAAPAMSEPTASPSRHARGPDQGRTASVLFGVVILAIGLWFFADQTLGLGLPRIRWSQLWPIVLIVIGAWIAVASMRRGSR